jgi:tripartite-type tricarboxylate transporter receptor subunit TctC
MVTALESGVRRGCNRLRAWIATCLAGLAIAGMAQGQTAYPSKPVRMIVPVTAGAPHDLVARLISERLAGVLGQPIIADNQPGASGAIGLTRLVEAAPDGHTLALAFMPQAIQQTLLGKAPYDMERDLSPVILLGWDFNVLVVHPSLPARSVAELIAHLKANPDKVNFGSGGNGTPAYVVAEFFKQSTGTQMTHVPYRGAMLAVQDLVAGRVQVMFAIAPLVVQHIRSGALRPLAAIAPHRLASAPDVPSVVEAGYPSLAIGSWFGIVAPSGTPADVVRRLNREIGAIVSTPGFRDRIAVAGGAEVVSGTPEEFRAVIALDMARWRRVVREGNLKAD